MKRLVGALGLIVLAAGVTQVIHSSFAKSDAAVESENIDQYIDASMFWREASGPNGERDPKALPLYEAVFAHDTNRTVDLLARGASPNALLYPGGWSPLMVAVAYNDRSTVEILVNNGSDLNYKSKDPATGPPLAVALTYGRFYPLKNPDFALFNYLIKSGADINAEFHGRDIAINAVNVGQIGIVNQLLAQGYRHDLPRLRKWLEITRVNSETQPEKDKAIATLNQLLAR